MSQAVVLAAGLLGAGAGSMLPRLAYRWSVPVGPPPLVACRHCRISFRSGLRGWVAFGNRCGNCGRNLGPSGLLLSGLLAAMSITLGWRLAPMAADELVLLAAWLLLAAVGLLLACVDVAVQRLPTPIVLVTAAALVGMVGVAAAVARQPWMLVNSLAAGGLLAGMYLLLALLGSGMGMGDVRLAGLLGLALGTVNWTAVVLGAVLPYLLAVPTALVRMRRGRGPQARQFPFGPYLVAGALLAACLVNT